jgi:hypothetical protein
MFINYSSISREISAKTWDIIENLWFLLKECFLFWETKFIIEIKMKFIFEINDYI